MCKVLVFLVALTVPFICGAVDVGDDVIVRDVQHGIEILNEKCKNVSGVDVERNERIYLELENCTNHVLVNLNLLRASIASIFHNFDPNSTFTFSDRQKTDLVALSQKHCSKPDDLIRCRLLVMPIFRECKESKESKESFMLETIFIEIFQRSNHFLCKNESMASFIGEKVIECGLGKLAEITNCFNEASRRAYTKLDATTVCKSIEMLRLCIVPIFEQCELSPTAGTIAKSLFTDLQTQTSCANALV